MTVTYRQPPQVPFGTAEGELLAEDATTARWSVGPCSLCRRGIARGDRYALLVPDGRAAHIRCIAAPRRRTVPAIR
jgi:hypothetical protein